MDRLQDDVNIWTDGNTTFGLISLSGPIVENEFMKNTYQQIQTELNVDVLSTQNSKTDKTDFGPADLALLTIKQLRDNPKTTMLLKVRAPDKLTSSTNVTTAYLTASRLDSVTGSVQPIYVSNTIPFDLITPPSIPEISSPLVKNGELQSSSPISFSVYK